VSDESSKPFFAEKELPRWVQIAAGLILGFLSLLCGFAALDLFVLAPRPISIFGVLAALLLLLGCLWVLGKCVRLLTGRKRGGLMSPMALRIVSYALLLVPIAGLFTGYYRRKGIVALLQAASYFVASFALRALARNREAEKHGSHTVNGYPQNTIGDGLDQERG
jgi:hypothetical protein